MYLFCLYQQMNVYDFKRILSGPNQGYYSHPFFRRDDMSNICKIVRKKQKSELCASPLMGSQGLPGGLFGSPSLIPPMAQLIDPGNVIKNQRLYLERQFGTANTSMMLPDLSLHDHGAISPSLGFFAPALNSAARQLHPSCKREEVVVYHSPLQRDSSNLEVMRFDQQCMFGPRTSRNLKDAIMSISSTLHSCNHDNAVPQRSSSCRLEDDAASIPCKTNDVVASIGSKILDSIAMHSDSKCDPNSQEKPSWKSQHGKTSARSSPDLGVANGSPPAKHNDMEDDSDDDDESIATIDDISGLMVHMDRMS